MKTLIPILLTMSIAACGFTPLYAGNPETNGTIDVGYIEGRDGYALRKALIRELAPGLPELQQPAQLTVRLRTGLRRLGLEPDGATSRSDFAATAVYALRLDENTVISGRSQVVSSFLAQNSPYGDVTAQVDTSDRAMNELARRIVRDLRLSMVKTE